MAYSIVESSASYFVTNKMELPRFQRKETWNKQAYFKLCISIFKGYPIGVVILNELGKSLFLLDGRQRRTTLKHMMENPVELYDWAKTFLKLKPKDSIQDVTTKFYETIEIYLQNEFNKATNDNIDIDDIDNLNSEQSFDAALQSENLSILLELILLVHGKYKSEITFIGMFKFDGLIPIDDLEYSIIENGVCKISPIRLNKYIKDLINYGYTSREVFTESLRKRYKLDDKKFAKISQYVERHFDYFQKCFETIEKADKVISNSKIGIIRLTNATTLDAQNIFSLVNGEGFSLTSEELLSARPFWNYSVSSPNEEVKTEAARLYKQLDINIPDNIVRWDLCATILSRIDKNHLIFANLDIAKPSDFTKKLTLGFKLISAIYIGGVSSKAVNALEKLNESALNWNTDIDVFINELNTIIAILEDCEYFKYIMAWKQSIMSLTSNTIALEFAALLYKKWLELGKPYKGNVTAVRKLQRDALVLYDRLAYEYGSRLWTGSSDSRLSTDLKEMSQRFSIIDAGAWETLIKDMAQGKNQAARKPILYHYYCLKKILPTLDLNTTYEVDHIYPQDQFKMSKTINIALMDSLCNYALLPKRENEEKGNRTIAELKTNKWLYEQVKKYAEVSDEDVEKFSDICNVNDLINQRLDLYLNAYGKIRDTLFNNQ